MARVGCPGARPWAFGTAAWGGGGGGATGGRMGTCPPLGIVATGFPADMGGGGGGGSGWPFLGWVGIVLPRVCLRVALFLGPEGSSVGSKGGVGISVMVALPFKLIISGSNIP